MITELLILLIIIVLIGFFVFYKSFTSLLKSKEESITEEKLKYKKLLSQKKSSEIVLGQVTEKLVPFLDVFPYDPQQATFVGQPIDYIIFGEDEITFVEVKSGNSKLNKRQRAIRNLVNDGKVTWAEISIKPEKVDGK